MNIWYNIPVKTRRRVCPIRTDAPLFGIGYGGRGKEGRLEPQDYSGRQKAENVFAVFKKPLHESLTSVLPVMLIVLVLCFTIAPVPNNAMVAFLLGGVMLIAGMGLFTLGSEMSMIPLGQAVGSEITRRKKVWIITVVGFLIGMIITVAEPDLQVLANQVPAIENNVIIWSVAVGVGVCWVSSCGGC